MMTSRTEELPAIVMPSIMVKPLAIAKPSMTAKPPAIAKASITAKPSVTLKPSTAAKSPKSEETARAARRAKALKSKTVMAIYLVVTFCVGAALLEMHGRAAAQAATRPAPRRVSPAPAVAAPAPVVEAPRTRGPVAPAPAGAPVPWGGWIG